MTQRTSKEVGQLVRERREALRLTQDGIDGVSSATVRKLESGSQTIFRRATLVALTDALGWPLDALERLTTGADPATFTVAQISAASGIDVPEDLTPEERAEVARYARFLRDQRGH